MSDRIQSRPECRSFEIPAAQKISAIATHTNRIGHVYSPSSGGGCTGRRWRSDAISASKDQASAAREIASAPLAKTTSVSKCWVWPKLWGNPIR